MEFRRHFIFCGFTSLMSKGRILLLGKDIHRLQRRGELLRRAGYTPFLTQSLQQARKICRELQFLAAVIGHAVDVRDRTQSIRYIRAECGVPVVLVTEGKELTGVKADAYVSLHEEERKLGQILATMTGGSRQVQ
jgi:hypothetical protein